MINPAAHHHCTLSTCLTRIIHQHCRQINGLMLLHGDVTGDSPKEPIWESLAPTIRLRKKWSKAGWLSVPVRSAGCPGHTDGYPSSPWPLSARCWDVNNIQTHSITIHNWNDWYQPGAISQQYPTSQVNRPSWSTRSRDLQSLPVG